MSLPLPRRIAQAALLLGAAAAPLVGAGAAHAATPHPQGLGGLTNLDGGGLGSAVDGASHKATGLANATGSDATRTTLPAAGRLVGTTAKAVVPTAKHAASQAGDTAGRSLGAAEESAAGAVPGAETLPATALPATRGLPVQGLPSRSVTSLDQLPVKGLPVI